jgi:hypothetical protein
MAIWPWEDPNDPNIRYRENLDLQEGEVYLRKFVEEFAKKLENVNKKDLEARGVLSYDATTNTAVVRLNGRTVSYGLSIGNVRIANNRMVINQEDIWFDLIGSTYCSTNGGTWYPDNPGLLIGTVQILYVPKDVAQTYYNTASRPDMMEPMYEVFIESGIDAASEWLSAAIATEFGVNPHLGLVILMIQVYIAARQSYNDMYLDNLLDAIEGCGTGQFVCIKTVTMYQPSLGYYSYIPVISIHTGTTFKDEYPTTGRFEFGVYRYWKTYII